MRRELNMTQVDKRIEVWNKAAELVKPIIEEHGLEEVVTGAIFGQTNRETKADQHIAHILHVANWLMEQDQVIM